MRAREQTVWNEKSCHRMILFTPYASFESAQPGHRGISWKAFDFP